MHTRCALVSGVQTCALPIYEQGDRIHPMPDARRLPVAINAHRLRFFGSDGSFSLGHGPGSLLSFNRLRGDLPRIFAAIVAPQAYLVDLFAAELGQRVVRHPDLARHLVGREARAEESRQIVGGHGAAGLPPHDRADALAEPLVGQAEYRAFIRVGMFVDSRLDLLTAALLAAPDEERKSTRLNPSHK